jgi:hypothetical protein
VGPPELTPSPPCFLEAFLPSPPPPLSERGTSNLQEVHRGRIRFLTPGHKGRFTGQSFSPTNSSFSNKYESISNIKIHNGHT